MLENEGQAPNLEGQAAGAANADQSKNVTQEIDYSKIDVSKLPESVIKETPAFKSLLSESIERRQQIKGLREQLEALEGEKPVTVPAQGANKTNQDADIPEWGKQILAQMNSVLDTNAQSQRAVLVNKALEKHGLPEGAGQYVQGSNAAEIEASAAGLVPLMATGAGSAGNVGGGQGGLDSSRQRIKDLVRGKSEPISATSPFDPGVQRQKGGGVFSKD